MTSASAKKLAHRPAVKAKKSAAQRRLWETPEYRTMMSGVLKEANGRDYRREQSRQKALGEWKSPTRKEQARKRAQELWADPEWSAKRRAELVARNKGENWK